MKVKSLSCVQLCNPVDCSPPGSSVHGILQARTLKWVAISFSRGSSRSQGSNPDLPHCRQTLYQLSHKGSSLQFRYDLNQIPYDYTVLVTNRFKGLDLIDRVPDELWNEVRDVVQETGIKTIPMEKKCKKQTNKQTKNYCTSALISHASKVMLKILQARLQQYMNCEIPGVQAGF